ncbi:hypothetical protein M404DRAFT_850385 [Pisolithus tinctorius Marx 270]|uniref:Uncharacterized protein n=1 Tax=Pisolithus tinctorius Marx 270 TaxID=870435 RepID=A0A0C3NSU8_PISTI|nr:hypothetical protein M404DRAFT_850385 [Pisolithus tinctorius Marx 270]
MCLAYRTLIPYSIGRVRGEKRQGNNPESFRRGSNYRCRCPDLSIHTRCRQWEMKWEFLHCAHIPPPMHPRRREDILAIGRCVDVP